MPSLRELQRDFVRAVRTTGLDAADTAGARVGIQVYRNNVREVLRKALANDYPVVQRLVGDACFGSLAWRFARAQPSRSGDLQDFTVGFPLFLRAEYGRTAFAYLEEVALLECAIQESLTAAEAVPLGIDVLAHRSEDEIGRLRFLAHPAVRFVRFRFPVFAIWCANRPGEETDEVIDLGSGAEFVGIRRARGQAWVTRMSPADFRFFSTVIGGEDLDSACRAALEIEPGYDLAGALAALFERQLVCGVHTGSHNCVSTGGDIHEHRSHLH